MSILRKNDGGVEDVSVIERRESSCVGWSIRRARFRGPKDLESAERRGTVEGDAGKLKRSCLMLTSAVS